MSKEKQRHAKILTQYVVKALGWDVQALKSSQELPIPKIIMQTIQSDTCELITAVDQIKDDGKIPAKATLAARWLSTHQLPKAEKVLLGLPEEHSDKLSDSSVLQLTEYIDKILIGVYSDAL